MTLILESIYRQYTFDICSKIVLFEIVTHANEIHPNGRNTAPKIIHMARCLESCFLDGEDKLLSQNKAAKWDNKILY